MASNALERAVIEAARRLVHTRRAGTSGYGLELQELEGAVATLEVHERTQDPAVIERGWHEVTEADQLRGKDGSFYPVIRTRKMQRGKYQVVVRVAGKPMTLTRPGPEDANPTAWVRRGPAGHAVDTITHVFASGPDPT